MRYSPVMRRSELNALVPDGRYFNEHPERPAPMGTASEIFIYRAIATAGGLALVVLLALGGTLYQLASEVEIDLLNKH